MDWKLLLIAGLLIVAGGFIIWRFRGSKFKTETGPGCLMAFGVLLLSTGILAIPFSFWMK